MSLVIIKGVPSIIWGTSNTVGTNMPAGATVESLRLTPKNGSPIEIEDNNGLAENMVLLRDGFNGKISALYDSSKTWPVEGANVGLVIPYTGAAANAIPFGESTVSSAVYNTNAVTYYCTLISIEPNYTRKKEAMIDFNLAYRPEIAP